MEYPRRPGGPPLGDDDKFEGRAAWAAGGGGIGTYTALTAAALARRGHDVHVLSCIPGQAASDVRDQDVHVHRRGHVRIRGLARITRAPSAAFRIAHAATTLKEARRLGRFDVVEAPDYVAEGLGVGLGGRTPLVCQLHGPRRVLLRAAGEPSRWNARASDAVERLAVRRADVVTSPSQLLIRLLAADDWLGSAEVRVVRSPVDLDAWRDVPPVADTPARLLVVGRLDATKAPEVVVDAASLITPEIPELEVVFVGSSNGMREGVAYATWVARRAEVLGVRARFVGRTSRSTVAELLGGTRVVAVCSRFDNFPLAALEALAAGRPVVCTEATGTSELLEDTRAGRVVAVDDPQATADALRLYLTDVTAAAAAGLEARAVVEQHCSPPGVAAQREACYHDAIARRSGLPGS